MFTGKTRADAGSLDTKITMLFERMIATNDFKNYGVQILAVIDEIAEKCGYAVASEYMSLYLSVKNEYGIKD